MARGFAPNQLGYFRLQLFEDPELEEQRLGTAAGHRVAILQGLRRHSALAVVLLSVLLLGVACLARATPVKAEQVADGHWQRLFAPTGDSLGDTVQRDWPNSSFIDALPIATTVPSTVRTDNAEAESRIPCEYGPAEEGESTCPKGSAALTEAECRGMPYRFGGVLNNPFAIESNSDPWGCFHFNGKFYYNWGLLGEGRPGRTPFCKRCQVVTDVAFAGPSAWNSANYVIRRVSPRFRLLHRTGSCKTNGFLPIADQALCEEAARSLLLRETKAAITCLEERPEGCYYLQKHEERKGMLFVNVNPRSVGNGAETSAFSQKIIRLPICMVEEDTTRTTTAAPLPTTSSATPAICRTESWAYRMITKGSCEDVGQAAFNDMDGCKNAAKELALPVTQPQVIYETNRPHGCYYYYNPEDFTTTLWYNLAPASLGHGAEEMRRVICGPLPETTTTAATVTSSTSTGSSSSSTSSSRATLSTTGSSTSSSSSSSSRSTSSSTRATSSRSSASSSSTSASISASTSTSTSTSRGASGTSGSSSSSMSSSSMSSSSMSSGSTSSPGPSTTVTSTSSSSASKASGASSTNTSSTTSSSSSRSSNSSSGSSGGSAGPSSVTTTATELLTTTMKMTTVRTTSLRSAGSGGGSSAVASDSRSNDTSDGSSAAATGGSGNATTDDGDEQHPHGDSDGSSKKDPQVVVKATPMLLLPEPRGRDSPEGPVRTSALPNLTAVKMHELD